MSHCDRFIKYAEETKWSNRLHSGYIHLGRAYHLIGDQDTARKHMQKGFDIQRETGDQIMLPFYYGWRSELHLDLRNRENALRYAEEALRLAQNNMERPGEGYPRITLGRVLGKSHPSQFDKAEQEILGGIAILEEMNLRPFCSVGYLYLGELYADTGRKEEAFENLNKAQSMFQEMGMDYWPAKTREVLDRL